jgi:ATP adenylyltransferase/5',5'''-P-1,P-4-tetraphosphate phosphorylase II
MSLRRLILSSAATAISRKAAFPLVLPNQIEKVIDHGFSVWLYFYNRDLRPSISSPPKKTARGPLLPPFDPYLHITDLVGGANHHLIVNKFMHTAGHVVLSSMDPNESQGDQLHASDFEALSQVLSSFDGEGIGYYNSGIESGCTQLHKHLQYAPLDGLPLFRAMASGRNLPWAYDSVGIRDMSARSIEIGYKEVFNRSRQKNEFAAYNFMVNGKNAVLVPRRKVGYRRIIVNSIGISGHLCVWESTVKLAREAPLSVLRELCIPK